MSIAATPLAALAVAEAKVAPRDKRPPATRLLVAKPDGRAMPEPR